MVTQLAQITKINSQFASLFAVKIESHWIIDEYYVKIQNVSCICDIRVIVNSRFSNNFPMTRSFILFNLPKNYNIYIIKWIIHSSSTLNVAYKLSPIHGRFFMYIHTCIAISRENRILPLGLQETHCRKRQRTGRKPYLFPQKEFVSVFYATNIFYTIYYFKPTNFNCAQSKKTPFVNSTLFSVLFTMHVSCLP